VLGLYQLCVVNRHSRVVFPNQDITVKVQGLETSGQALGNNLEKLENGNRDMVLDICCCSVAFGKDCAVSHKKSENTTLHRLDVKGVYATHQLYGSYENFTI
jgi:hypothetical protein